MYGKRETKACESEEEEESEKEKQSEEAKERKKERKHKRKSQSRNEEKLRELKNSNGIQNREKRDESEKETQFVVGGNLLNGKQYLRFTVAHFEQMSFPYCG